MLSRNGSAAIRDFLGSLARDDHHAVAVGDDDIAWTHQHATHSDGPVHRLELVPARPDAARETPEPDRHLVMR